MACAVPALKPRRHPMVGACLAFVAGCAVGVRVLGAGFLPGLLFFSALAAWVVFLWAGRSRRVFTGFAAAALLVAAFACGMFSARDAARTRMDTVELFREVIESGESAVLRGRVATEPTVTSLPHGGARLRFELETREIPFECDVIPVDSFRVRVDWYGPRSMGASRPPFTVPRAGEGWQISGTLSEVETRSAVPLLVFRHTGRDGASRRVTEFDDPPALAALWELRSEAARALGRRVFPDWNRAECASLVRAMVLGFRSDIPPTVEDAFRNSGTVHVFAISGLHVGIVAGALIALMLACGLSRRWSPLFVAPLLFVYVMATGARPSAVRALVMTLLTLSAPMFGRERDPVTALCFSAALILAVDPMQLLDLGYVYSFACMAGIVLLYPALLRVAVNVVGRIRPGAEPGKTVQAFTVSVATWLVSVPISAACFGVLTPVSVLCNLVVIPCATLVVVFALCSLAAAAVGAFVPVFGLVSAFCNEVNEVVVYAMQLICGACARIPGGNFAVAQWRPSAVVCWYAVLALFILRAAKNGK